MIRLTRLNHLPLVLNCDLIEHIDVTPDTVITMTTGEILRVLESADEIVRRIVEYRRKILGTPEQDVWPAEFETSAPEVPAPVVLTPVEPAPVVLAEVSE
jgi:flagellar protein FlbD